LLYLNGIQFEQVYSSAKIATPVRCGYNPTFAQPSGGTGLDSLDNLTSPLPLPEVDEVTSWLRRNAVNTTQPFAAFVDVFQKHGDDDAAKQLRISRATTELEAKTSRLFRPDPPDTAVPATAAAFFAPLWNGIKSVFRFVTGLAAVLFGWLLYLLADNGYRPEKVVWWVAAIIILSGLYFWLRLNVIAIRPEHKNEPLPIGFLFLFDRLLPAYQVREDHYKIDKYMKWVPRDYSPGPGETLAELRYFRKKFHLLEVPANHDDIKRAERALDIIKFLGLVLAIFLVAAVNALVSH
jgi:hypothetical protein